MKKEPNKRPGACKRLARGYKLGLIKVVLKKLCAAVPTFEV